MIPDGFRSSGPCFVCSEAIAYGEYERKSDWGGKKRWEASLFDEYEGDDERASIIAALEEGGRPSYGGSVDFDWELERVWVRFVCAKCKDRLKRQWPQKAEERQKRADEEHFRTTWRQPGPGEFPITSGRRDFVVRSFGTAKSLLVFRWRTCLTNKCRGNDPAHRVGLWVKNRLCAHYYGWDFGADEQDLFGPGAAFWIEKAFQRDLLKVKPQAVWYARPPASRRCDEWNGIDTVHACLDPMDYDRFMNPCVIHTVWPNGAVYAQLRNFSSLKEIAEFAWESLHIDIRDAADVAKH